MDFNSRVAEVKIPFIFFIGELIFGKYLETIEDRPTVSYVVVKGTVHPKSFILPQVVPNLYVEHQRRYFEEC